jgi:hypothetical protein
MTRVERRLGQSGHAGVNGKGQGASHRPFDVYFGPLSNQLFPFKIMFTHSSLKQIFIKQSLSDDGRVDQFNNFTVNFFYKDSIKKIKLKEQLRFIYQMALA